MSKVTPTDPKPGGDGSLNLQMPTFNLSDAVAAAEDMTLSVKQKQEVVNNFFTSQMVAAGMIEEGQEEAHDGRYKNLSHAKMLAQIELDHPRR